MKEREILPVRKVTAVNCFLLEDQQWLLSPEGKSMMKSKASKQNFVELDTKPLLGRLKFCILWFYERIVEIKKRCSKCQLDVSFLFFVFFCIMFLEILRQRSLFATILFSLNSLSVQLTPNSHENSKENCCPVIKKVGDLRNTKKDHPVVKIIQIHFNSMTFTLTDDLD